MKKVYEVTTDFWVGEINQKLSKGQEVSYDLEKGKLAISKDDEEKIFDVKNLKAAIKAKWLVPVTGDYSDLDEPLGETQIEAMERKRKERFAEMQKKRKDNDFLVKDEQEVGKVVGMIDEERDPLKFSQELGVEPVASDKKKFSKEVIEDDTKVVTSGKLFDDTETNNIKKAMNQDTAVKKEKKDFKVFTDHYDADTVEVGSYKDISNENTLHTWSKLHWSKKADLIKTSDDKVFLKQIKDLETSAKIIKRIEDRLADL
jgi:hypothetical protein